MLDKKYTDGIVGEMRFKNIWKENVVCVGSYREEDDFRYMKKQDRYNCYCKDCERLYNRDYQRIYRERKKDIKNGWRYRLVNKQRRKYRVEGANKIWKCIVK